ncbi:MAG: patatin-like phospholipase family protein [Bacteroidales bacterium]|jgi:NTE family protein
MIEKPFVLSGGGCRGFAHLGALKALQERGIKPGKISGASAGAIAGAFLANGFSPDEIKEMFVGKLNLSMISWTGFKMGLVSIKNIKKFIEKNLRYNKFEELPIPFYVATTNFINGKQQLFHNGNIIDPIIASSSIPVLFPPVIIDDIPYVDGGLSNNLPIEPFQDEKNEIISISVNPTGPFKPEEGILELLDKTIHLSIRGMVNQSSSGCFLFIEPENLVNYGLFDINKINDIFEIGYSFTKTLLNNTEISLIDKASFKIERFTPRYDNLLG